MSAFFFNIGKIMQILKEELQIHDTLNKKLFDDSGKLYPDIRNKILEIVAAFENDLSIPITILDAHLTGSNVSYNYTEHSDLDVHVIANFDQIDENTDVVKALYDLERIEFNKNYDIKIKGIEIEIYVEDVRSVSVSNGIYSVCMDEWVKEPKPIKRVAIKDNSKEVEKWKNHIATVLASGDAKKVQDTIDTLYLIRHNALSDGDEFSMGNILFKDIRNLGLLDKLKDEAKKLKAQDLSMEALEGYSYGKIATSL